MTLASMLLATEGGVHSLGQGVGSDAVINL